MRKAEEIYLDLVDLKIRFNKVKEEALELLDSKDINELNKGIFLSICYIIDHPRMGKPYSYRCYCGQIMDGKAKPFKLP